MAQGGAGGMQASKEMQAFLEREQQLAQVGRRAARSLAGRGRGPWRP